MRTFTKFEQDIIKQIIKVDDLKDRLGAQFFYKNFDFIAIEWDKTYSLFSIIQARSSNEMQNEINVIYDRICEIIFLFNYLESNMLISWYNIPKEENEGLFFYDHIKYEREDNTYHLKNEDGSKGYYLTRTLEVYSDIGRLFEKYINSCIYVSETLRELVDNSFETENQKQFNEMRKLSGFSILVTALIGIVSIVFTGILSNKPNPIMIDTSDIITKLDSMNSYNRQISIQLDSLVRKIK